MNTPPHLTRRDFSYTVWFLLGSGGFWFMPYAFSRWLPAALLLSIIPMILSLAIASVGSIGLVLRPFIFEPRDKRWSQCLLRMVFLIGIGTASVSYFNKQFPNPSSVGDWHRLTDRAKPEDFRSLAKWLIKEAADRPALRRLENDPVTEFLASSDGKNFASITKIWGEPNALTVEEGAHPTTVYFNWGGGFGHWGVEVRFDSVSLQSDKHLEVWKWDEDVYFWREIQ